jgi:ATP-dependent DNA ligase
MSLYKIIESVAAIGSTKEKQAILEKNKGNEMLRKAFLYAENPRFNFYIKVKPEDLLAGLGEYDITNSTFTALDKLVARQFTGNAARTHVEGMLSDLTHEAQIILARIINKDLRCNAGTAIANKVWKDLIPEYPMMLASKHDEKAIKNLQKYENKAGFIVQKKCDGGRVNVLIDNDGNVVYRSRAGNILNMYGLFDHVFTKYKNQVFDGELLVKGKNGIVDRKTGNGFYTKLVRGTATEAEVKAFYLEVWDVITTEEFLAGVGTFPYKERLADLNFMISKEDARIQVVESKECATLEECYTFYAEMRDRKEEGAIIKVADAVWEDRRSKNMVKLKAEESADLLCVGWNPGKVGSQFDGMIGSLVMQTSCGLLEVNSGSGLTPEDRAKNPEYYLGKIIEIAYNEVISSKDPKKTTKSLFLPIYKQIRFDKTFANKLSELK